MHNFSLPPVPPGTPLVAPPPQVGQPPETMPMQDAMAGQYVQPAAQPWMQPPPQQTLAQAQQPSMPDNTGMMTAEQAFYFQQAQLQQAQQQQQFVQQQAQQQAPAPAAPPAQPQMSFEQLCAHYVDVDGQLSAASAEYKAYEASMKAIRDKLEVAILASIPRDVDAITAHGYVFKPSEKIRYQTKEGEADAFWSWVKVNNRIDLLDKRISQTGAETLIANTHAWFQQQVAAGAYGDQPAPAVTLYYPPGLDIKRTPSLSVTKARKAANLVSE